MLLRVAALAVAPQVIRVLTRPSQAEAQRAVPVATEQHTEQPAPVVTSPLKKVQIPPPPLWQNSVSTKRKSPILRAWWASRGSRGPPSPRAGSRSWAYLHPRSYPVNFVDPDGLEPEFTTEQLETLTSGLGLYNDFLIGELGGRVFSELLALLKFRTICPPRYPRLIRGDGRSMVKQTTNELKFINPAARPQATRDFLNQVKNLNPRWSFSEENAVDGASVFRGGAGEAILIDRQGRVYRGNVNDLPDPGAGPYSGWEGVFREVVPYQPGFRSSY